MPDEIDNPIEAGGHVSVDFGPAGTLTMQAVQHIYNEITGKSEQLERQYRVNHLVSFEDIQQLYTKIKQISEQFHTVSSNCAITIYHLDEQKQVFSSFDRFKFYDRTTLCPVTHVFLEFNMLIVLPHVHKPQSLKIEINLNSRAALVKQARAEASFQYEFLFHMIQTRTGSVEITYVDYMVAKTYEGAIDTWFKGLPCVPSQQWLLFIQRNSPENFPLVFRFLGILVYLMSAYEHFSSVLTSATNSQTLYFAGTTTFGGAVLMGIVFHRIGVAVADALRNIKPLSYINLTRGDEITFKEMKGSNRKAIGRVIVNTGFAVAIKVFASWLTIRIGIS